MAEARRRVIAANPNHAAGVAELSRFLLAAMRAVVAVAMLYAMALRCLIVDDNGSFLDAASVLLEREGMSVVGTSSTTADALTRAQELEPDVVLVDVVLGDESGFDLARRLDEAGRRVVMVSTHAAGDVVDLLAESPAAGFLSKSELSAAAIRRVLDGRSPQAPAA